MPMASNMSVTIFPCDLSIITSNKKEINKFDILHWMCYTRHMNNTNIQDYQVKQYDGVNSVRDVSFDSEEVKLLVSLIDKWHWNLVPYHNYYDDVEFVDSIKHFLQQDGRLSQKQMKRLSNFNL